jgi:hypothetical protein
MTVLRTCALLSAGVLSVLPSSSAAQAQQASAIDALVPEIQGKRPADVRALIIERLGPPARDVGSGLRIDEWDVDGGVLTFHPVIGPTFDKGEVHRWLIHTNNPAALCLFGTYEMRTVPEELHGTTYWLGAVALSRNLRYRYTDGHQNLDQRAKQHDNFFMLHPIGRTRLAYARGVTPQTRLEDLPDGSLVATVTFVARRRRASKTYRIVASRTEMRLAFESEAMPFQLDKAWVNYWR